MRITPRRQEIDRVAEMLEAGEYEGPRDLARALIKEIADMVAMRDLWVVAHTWVDGTRGLNLGPLGSEGDAKKLCERLGGVGGTAHVVPLSSSEVLVANQTGKAGWSPWCLVDECGHAPFLHSAAAAARGECMVPGCECPTYKK